MNGAQLQAWVNGHKGEAAAGGALLVVGAVYWRKHHAAAAATTGASSFTVPATVGGAPYDSSANDVYNSVESVLEQLQNTAAQISTTAPVTQQVPVTPTPPVNVAAPVASPPAIVPPPDFTKLIAYQAPGSDTVYHQALPPQAAPYPNGQLLVVENGRQFQFADTPDGRANIANQGGVIVGGY